MFPSRTEPAAPAVPECLWAASRPLTSIVLMVLTGWSAASAGLWPTHADAIIDYLGIKSVPSDCIMQTETNGSRLKSITGDWTSPMVLSKFTNRIVDNV